RPDAEMVAADAHIGYYRRGAILERIEADILAPARRRGHDEIWLVGTSLGGGGALLLGERYCDQLAGLILLAPYVGPDDLLDHVTATGTVDGFVPKSERDRAFRDVWSWILGRAEKATPKIVLGYGRDDRNVDDHARLAEHLDEASIVVLDGGHDWPVWRDALAALLDRGALR
ncbi:MAG: alpha/beta hydrolase-fold protein, partial [Acidobacteriota bacterium]